MRVLWILFFTCLSVVCLGQKMDQEWETEEDYRAAETDIVEKIIWLEENPFYTSVNDTKTISNYVLDWITGAPHIEVVLEEWFTSEFTKNKKYKYSDKMRVTYLFGKSLYLIQNPDDPDPVKASTRGLEGVVKMYNELLERDRNAKHKSLDYYAYLYETERLEQYVEEEYSSLGSSF